jgi:uroporphyrinogen-III synthase
MHLLLTRPEPDSEAMVVRLERLGHRVTRCPLLEIRYENHAPPTLDGVQAIVATSRHGLRSLARRGLSGEALARPVFAVGWATAEEARTLGFSRVIEGPASARDLVPLIAGKAQPADGALLYPAGDVLAFDVKTALEERGFAVHQEIAYRSVAAERLDPPVADAIRAGAIDGVLLMSPRTAAVFAELVRREGLAATAARLTFYCLSQSVAAALGPLAPRRVAVAVKPSSEELLALLARAGPESA